MKTRRTAYYTINAITLYRLVAAPFLVLMAIAEARDMFKWFMLLSFLTDAVDGPLSRRYKVESIFGSRLDSVADDATVLVSTIALWFFHPTFISDNWMIIAGLFGLFGIQTSVALIAYKKVTSFHTYLAKAAAVAQGMFFIAFFFSVSFAYELFLLASGITAIQLVEEVLLVMILPEWKANVKGLYWVWRSRGQVIQSK